VGLFGIKLGNVLLVLTRFDKCIFNLFELSFEVVVERVRYLLVSYFSLLRRPV